MSAQGYLASLDDGLFSGTIAAVGRARFGENRAGKCEREYRLRRTRLTLVTFVLSFFRSSASASASAGRPAELEPALEVFSC